MQTTGEEPTPATPAPAPLVVDLCCDGDDGPGTGVAAAPGGADAAAAVNTAIKNNMAADGAASAGAATPVPGAPPPSDAAPGAPAGATQTPPESAAVATTPAPQAPAGEAAAAAATAAHSDATPARSDANAAAAAAGSEGAAGADAGGGEGGATGAGAAGAAAAAAAGEPDDNDGSPWLYRLVTCHRYFQQCPACTEPGRAPKREQLLTLFDTERPGHLYCSACPEARRRAAVVLQVRRSAFRDVAKGADLTRLGADVTAVQQYTLNGSKVVYLNREGAGATGSDNKKYLQHQLVPSTCVVDGRAMMDKANKYCSMRCKLVTEDAAFKKWLDARDEAAKAAAAAAASAPPRPTAACKRVLPNGYPVSPFPYPTRSAAGGGGGGGFDSANASPAGSNKSARLAAMDWGGPGASARSSARAAVAAAVAAVTGRGDTAGGGRGDAAGAGTPSRKRGLQQPHERAAAALAQQDAGGYGLHPQAPPQRRWPPPPPPAVSDDWAAAVSQVTAEAVARVAEMAFGAAAAAGCVAPGADFVRRLAVGDWTPGPGWPAFEVGDVVPPDVGDDA